MPGDNAIKDFFLSRQWRGRPYLFSPFLDFGLVGGFALAALTLLLLAVPHDAASQSYLFTVLLMGVLVFVVNDPHFMLSYQLLYSNYGRKLHAFRQHRELWLRYVVAGIVVPAGMALYFLYALARQDAQLISWAFTAMYVSVSWHYAKQSYGLIIVLSAMKQIYYGRWQRHALLANAYVVWLFMCIALVAADPLILSDTVGFPYTPPHYITLSGEEWEWLGVIVTVSGLGAIIAAVWDKKAPSKTGLLGYLSMYYLLFLSGMHPLWVLVFPFFHSLQYLMFVYAYKRGEVGIKLSEAKDPGEAQAIRDYLKRFVLIAFVTSALFFAALPFALETLFNPAQAFLFPMAAIALIFINIHHYFIDNVIWRKENAEVSKCLFHRP